MYLNGVSTMEKMILKEIYDVLWDDIWTGFSNPSFFLLFFITEKISLYNEKNLSSKRP